MIQIILIFLLTLGCTAGNIGSSDPTERGLSYIAGAILTAAVMRAIFNK